MPAQPMVPVGVPQKAREPAVEDRASLTLLLGPGIFSLLPAQPASSSSASALSQGGRRHSRA